MERPPIPGVIDGLMTHQPDSSLLVRLIETLLIAGGGFLLVTLLAHGSAMSKGELLIGPLAVALIWLGITGALPHPRGHA
jgi:hypothetical protein